MNKSIREQALQFVKDDLEKFKRTLAANGKTLDDWLEEQRIKTEETRRRVGAREAAEREAKEKEGDEL